MTKTMTCEQDVKAVVKTLFKKYGVWYFMPVQTGYTRAGIPDFIACVPHCLLAVETKFGDNTPTENQRQELAAIEAAGGQTFVIDETSVHVLEQWLDRYMTFGSP